MLLWLCLFISNVPCVCHVAELNTNLNKQTMKRIKLTHGSTRVSENITDETKEALNKMTELAYKHQTEQCDIHSVVDSALRKDRRHSHFWVEDERLFESYRTIRGLRYRYRFDVNGVADCERCTPEMLLYIAKEYLGC